MLQLKDISSVVRKIYNESDYYVKIRVLFQQIEPYSGFCYWNAYGKESSLTEIALHNPAGGIYGLTVLFVSSNIQHKDISVVNNNITEKIGFPLFETYIEKYQDGYYHLPEERIDFEVYAGERNATILFSSNSVVLHVVNDPVVFGFDSDNNLCYIHMQNMTLNDEGFLEQKII